MKLHELHPVRQVVEAMGYQENPSEEYKAEFYRRLRDFGYPTSVLNWPTVDRFIRPEIPHAPSFQRT